MGMDANEVPGKREPAMREEWLKRDLPSLQWPRKKAADRSQVQQMYKRMDKSKL